MRVTQGAYAPPMLSIPLTYHGAQLSYRQKGDDLFTRLQMLRIVEAPNVDSMIQIR
jgi:hypothetical protein